MSPSPSEETLYDLAELFKIFGDSTRIKILYALSEREYFVSDLADSLGMTQSAVSHQLRVLKNGRLVRGAREGKTISYALADAHVFTILDQGLSHIGEVASHPVDEDLLFGPPETEV